MTSVTLPGGGAAVPLDRPAALRLPGLALAGAASLGAGAVHAAATGIHAEHAQLARIFVATAVLQLGAGLVAIVRPARWVAWAVALVNAAAVGGWLLTRIAGIGWIDGLEVREAPQFADTACALLGALAVGAALAGALVGWRAAHPPRLAFSSLAVAAIAVPAMLLGSTHVHSDGGAAHSHGTPTDGAADGADESQPHDHGTTTKVDDTQPHDHPVDTVTWPRPWDPSQPIDLSGVPGVSIEQEARAVALVEATLRELPKYADPAAAIADGYASIGDASTGSEHFIKGSLINDDVLLDPTQPESLVYTVENGTRTLAGAMFIASARPADDPSLTGWAGPLMTWHKHDNLCWAIGADGKAKVVGIIDAAGHCANGVRAGGENPMVHVWITPHPCGVFAALEGIGAGTAAVSEAERVDLCHADGHDHGTTPTVTPKPYDPTQPIDLSGTAGVTPEQQAAAENLIAITLIRLPQWSDYRVAEKAGFRSIGDGITGHEHFIQWDWINDDVWLNPDFPESLVYEPQPDGSKRLVSAMYMLPRTVALADVPDIGGALMQWHVHDDLCFTSDPVAPRVAGVTSVGGTCAAGLVKFEPAPMIHVWITPHPCGPFAALEGVGAGQIKPGEERLCDHAHGAPGF
jgi:hypothetical protein